jgi:dienelactone hydrolase
MKKIFLIAGFCLFSIMLFAGVGHRTITFNDAARTGGFGSGGGTGRQIQTEIYYPAASTADNVPITGSNYPVIVFGHGFSMTWDAYDNIWTELVNQGYVIAFPRTEGGLSPTHMDLGKDLATIAAKMQSLNTTSGSFFFGKLVDKTALMGHSMGGGATYLAPTYGGANITTIVSMAAANSTPAVTSSIVQAALISIPNLLFVGQNDCVAPPTAHQNLIYNALISPYKTEITIIGAAHCEFANFNTSCSFGQSTCSPSPLITGAQQKDVLNDHMKLWLGYYLKGICANAIAFQDSLATSNRTTFRQSTPFLPISFGATITNSTCSLANGNVAILATGGVGPLTYLWNNGQTTANLTNALPGTYTLTATDANNCPSTYNVTVTTTVSTITATSVVTNNLCSATSLGSITVTPTLGTSPYTYFWNGSTNITNTRSNLAAGSYTCIVTDAFGCTYNSVNTVSNTGTLSSSATSTNVNCFGASTGSVTALAVNGTGPYTYSWTGYPNTTSTLANLPAGTYICTITDNNGCSTSINKIVTQPINQINVTGTITNSICTSSTGGITINSTGGTSPYTYLWNNGQQTANLINVTSGNYSLTVTDQNNCTQLYPVIIGTSNSNLTATSINVSNNCSASATGSATILPTLGTSPYTFVWSGSVITTGTRTGLTSGSYYCTVADANGCTFPISVSITNSNTLSSTATSTPVNCFGASTGTATVTATAGVSPYTYSWTGNTSSSNVLSGVDAGTYSCTITDNVGCITTTSATISQPSSSVNTTISTISSSCTAANGSATSTNVGGTQPYTFLWSNGQTTSNLSNVNAGIYTLTITDANFCQHSENTIILSNSNLTASSLAIDNSCSTTTNGSILITPTLGASPYSYYWNGSTSTSSSRNNLGSGTYTCTITDANGCTFLISDTLTTLSNLSSSSIITNVSCFGQSNGNITAIGANGPAPYSYAWSTSNVTSNMLNNQAAGTYICTITDAAGCASQTIGVVTQPNLLTLAGNVNNSTSSISTSTNGGTGPYIYFWSNGTTTQNLNNVADGMYTQTVTDANGCSSDQTFTVASTTDLALNEIYSILVYPNPFENQITIDYDGNITWNISDFNGKTILFGTEKHLSTSMLSVGVYFLKVSDDLNNSKTIKIYKK